MPRFQFRLERVRQWQSRVCTAQEEKLRDSLRSLAERDQALAGIRAEFLAVKERWRQSPVLDTADLRAWSAYRSTFSRRERSLLTAQLTASQVVEEQRDELLRARKRLQMIEKLRDRALREYQGGIEHELEEVAMTAHLHDFSARRNALQGKG